MVYENSYRWFLQKKMGTRTFPLNRKISINNIKKTYFF